MEIYKLIRLVVCQLALTSSHHPPVAPNIRAIMSDTGYAVLLFDLHRESDQRKLGIFVRPTYTIAKVIEHIKTQYPYEDFDLLYQPQDFPITKLNNKTEELFYNIPGFKETNEDVLLMLEKDSWNGNQLVKINFHKYLRGDDPVEMMADVDDVYSSDMSVNIVEHSNCEDSGEDDLALGASASPTHLENDINEDTRSDVGNDPLDCLQKSYTGKVSMDQDLMNKFLRDNQAEGIEMPAVVLSEVPTVEASESQPQPLSVSNERHYVGLVNQAMTCYLNSLLQALYMTPEFRNALYEYQFTEQDETSSIPYQLQKLFVNLQTSTRSAVETTALTHSFGWNSTESWQQHDVQELCRLLFEALEVKFKHTKHADLISSLYEGKMADVISCQECNRARIKMDTFLDIALPVRSEEHAHASIEEALQAFSQFETLDGSNQYFCEHCNKKCDAQKGLRFKKFPYILTLHLKRFTFHETRSRIKLSDRVSFPYTLNLNEYISADRQPAGTSAASDDSRTTDSAMSMNEDSQSTASSNQQSNQPDDEGIDETMSGDCDSNASLYNYELFAVMIHSGNGIGGHYFAYIKDLETNEWLSFNDTLVTKLPEGEIEKSFGSAPSAYSPSSSSCAYMLMYRQIDQSRNQLPMAPTQFPEHIKQLVEKLQNEEAHRERSGGGAGPSYLHSGGVCLISAVRPPPRVHFYDHHYQKLVQKRMSFASGGEDTSYEQLLRAAHEAVGLDEEYAPISRCRLVAYDKREEKIVQSFADEQAYADYRASVKRDEYLLEVARENQTLPLYNSHGVTWQLYVIDVRAGLVDGPHILYTQSEELGAIRQAAANYLALNPDELLVSFSTIACKKAFVAPCSQLKLQKLFAEMTRTRFRLINYLYLNVPDISPAALRELNVPVPIVAEQQGVDVVDAALIKPAKKLTSAELGELSKCNEDPSIYDSYNGGASSQRVAKKEYYVDADVEDDDDDEDDDDLRYFSAWQKDYFHACKLAAVENFAILSEPPRVGCMLQKPVTAYKLHAYKTMKVEQLKQHIAQLIDVPENYFTLLKNRKEVVDSTDTLMMLDDGETLSIDVGASLTHDERRAKVHFFELTGLSRSTACLDTGLCYWVFKPKTTLGIEAKCQLVDKLRNTSELCAGLTMENCRLWYKVGVAVHPVQDDSYLDVAANCFFVQQCADAESARKRDVMFVRRYKPDAKPELDELQEVELTADIAGDLARATDIPTASLVYVKIHLDNFASWDPSELQDATWQHVSRLQTPDAFSMTGKIFICKESNTECMAMDVSPSKLETNTPLHLRADDTPPRSRVVTGGKRTENALKIVIK